jgi:hypothetical protein
VVVWGGEAAYDGAQSYRQRHTPPGLSGVTQIAAGFLHTVALVANPDCNTNGQRDSYEIALGLVEDMNRNGIPDNCEQFAGFDLDLNGIIDTADLSLMLLDFGPCPNCPDDFDGDGDVTTADIALLLLNFGPTD